jgi:zinc/manganese transport system substrate-binding protein
VTSRRNVLTLLLTCLGWLGTCGVAPAQAPAEKLEVVATFSILGDFVREVGRERVALTTLVGPDGDAHVYSPAPGDSRKLARATLIVVNGLGLEGWMARLIKSSGARGAVVEAAKGVNALKARDDHAQGGFDPHAWQDVANARIYVGNIRDALSRADPAGREAYEANAAAYLDALAGLDREVGAAVAAIPAERRRVITTHDAFDYFKAAYGLDFVAPQGVSTDAEASAKDVARIIRQIKAERIPAVFLENVADPRLMDRIAKETGARTGGRLYSDALSAPDGPAGTYIAMVRHNIRAFSDALSR